MKKLLSTLLLSAVAVAGYSQGSPAARPATTGTVETVTSAVYYVPPDVMRWFLTNRIPTSNTIFSIVQFVIGTNGGSGGVSTNIGAFAPLSMEIIGGSNIFKFSGGVTNLQPGTFWPNGIVSNATLNAVELSSGYQTNIIVNTNVLYIYRKDSGTIQTVTPTNLDSSYCYTSSVPARFVKNSGGFLTAMYVNGALRASNLNTASFEQKTGWIVDGTNFPLATYYDRSYQFGTISAGSGYANLNGVLVSNNTTLVPSNLTVNATTWHAGPVNISGTNQSGYVFKILGSNGISFFGLDRFGGITYNTYEYMNANAFATHIPAFSQAAMKGWTADVHHGINSLGYSTDGNPMYSLTNTYWWMHWTSVGGSQAGAETTNQFFPIGRSALRMENWGGLLLQNPSVGYTSIATGFTSNSADSIDFPVLRWNDSKLLDRTNFADAAIPTNWFMLKSEFGNTIIGSYNPNDPTNLVNRPIVLNTNGSVIITNLLVPDPIKTNQAASKAYVDSHASTNVPGLNSSGTVNTLDLTVTNVLRIGTQEVAQLIVTNVTFVNGLHFTTLSNFSTDNGVTYSNLSGKVLDLRGALVELGGSGNVASGRIRMSGQIWPTTDATFGNDVANASQTIGISCVLTNLGSLQWSNETGSSGSLIWHAGYWN